MKVPQSMNITCERQTDESFIVSSNTIIKQRTVIVDNDGDIKSNPIRSLNVSACFTRMTTDNALTPLLRRYYKTEADRFAGRFKWAKEDESVTRDLNCWKTEQYNILRDSWKGVLGER